jgi:hypothetical protein
VLEKALQLKDDPNVRFQRALAHYHLGNNDKALEDLSWLIGKFPKTAQTYPVRAIVHARLGKATEAKDDLARFGELSTDAAQKAHVDAIVSAHLGEDAEGLKRLETVIAANPKQVDFLYNAACAYSVASQVVGGKDAARAKKYADRAVALLQQAIANGYWNYSHMQADPDLDPIRGQLGTILKPGSLERRYTAAWHPVAGHTSTEIHGLDPVAHLARCQELIAQGYRPVSWSAAFLPPSPPAGGEGRGEGVFTASVWHRPVVPDDEKEKLAKRQANAAVALLKMNQPEKVWPLLNHQPDPRVRSYLIHRFSPLGADAGAIVKQLEEEKEVSSRRALLLCLGEFGEKELAAGQRNALLPKLLDLYRNDPDSGIHGSVVWLLRQWGHKDKLKEIDKELAKLPAPSPPTPLPQGGEGRNVRRWYVNGQQQTFAIIPAGDFLMGSPRTQAQREGGPENRLETLHKKRMGRAFAIATHEVTVEQFLRFRKNYDYNRQYAPTDDCPASNVSWYEAAEYCNWLSEQEGIPKDQWCYLPNDKGQYAEGMSLAPDYLKRTGYRLPSEAEWEFACRAGALTSRYYGETEDLLGKYAWYSKNSLDRWMLPVGSLKPNDWGLFDMLGNGAEWCQEQTVFYTLGRAGQPSEDREQRGPISDRNVRVLRGGSVSNLPMIVRCANRTRYVPTTRYINVGFRAARTLPLDFFTLLPLDTPAK